MVEMAQAKLKKAVIKAIGTEQFYKWSTNNEFYTQKNGKDVGDSHGKKEPINPLRVPDPSFIKMKSSTFDIREEGFNRETFLVPFWGLFEAAEVGDKKPMVHFFLVPDDQNIEWADLFSLSKYDIRQEGFFTFG